MKMRNNIAIASILLILILVIPTMIFWRFVKCHFFSYSLIDIFDVICTFLIGIVVTIYFSHAFSNSTKRLEIIVENLNTLQDYYTRIIETISDTSQKKLTDTSKNHLLQLFRFAANELYNLKEYLNDEIGANEYLRNNLIEIEKKYFMLKEIVTDAPFATNQVITENDIKKSTECFYFLKHKIQKLKLNLYK